MRTPPLIIMRLGARLEWSAHSMESHGSMESHPSLSKTQAAHSLSHPVSPVESWPLALELGPEACAVGYCVHCSSHCLPAHGGVGGRGGGMEEDTHFHNSGNSLPPVTSPITPISGREKSGHSEPQQQLQAGVGGGL